MIEDDVYAENLHEFIKALCGGALEERIGLALVAHAVDDVAAFHIFFDEAVDDVNVILQVGIHADGAVAQRHGGHEAGEQGVLVAAVVRELYAVHIGNSFGVFGDNRPGFILAAVIDIENAAFGIDLLGADHGVHFFGQTLGGLRQYGFLVVARNDEIQDRNITFSRHYQNLLSFPKRGRFDCAVLRE